MKSIFSITTFYGLIASVTFFAQMATAEDGKKFKESFEQFLKVDTAEQLSAMMTGNDDATRHLVELIGRTFSKDAATDLPAARKAAFVLRYHVTNIGTPDILLNDKNLLDILIDVLNQYDANVLQLSNVKEQSYVASDIVETLGALKSNRAVDALKTTLIGKKASANESKRLSVQAAEALARTCTKDSFAVLEKVIVDSKTPASFRSQAIESLQNCKAEPVVKFLTNIALGLSQFPNFSQEQRFAAIDTLGNMGSQLSTVALIDLHKEASTDDMLARILLNLAPGHMDRSSDQKYKGTIVSLLSAVHEKHETSQNRVKSVATARVVKKLWEK